MLDTRQFVRYDRFLTKGMNVLIKGYLTVKEFALSCGITRQAVSLRIKKGELKAIKLGDQISYLIPANEARKWKSVETKTRHRIEKFRNTKKK